MLGAAHWAGRRQVSPTVLAETAAQSLYRPKRGKHGPGSNRTPIPMRSWLARSPSAYFCNPCTLLTTLRIREKDPSEPQPFIRMKAANGKMLYGAGQKSVLSALTVSDSKTRTVIGPIESPNMPKLTRPTADARLKASKRCPGLKSVKGRYDQGNSHWTILL